jgi:DNA-binding MarR family transcriptional regulator
MCSAIVAVGQGDVSELDQPHLGVDPEVAESVIDEVLTATRALIALTARSLGTLAEDLSAAQYRALVVLASRGPQRMVDLAHLLGVEPSSFGRMCERLVRKGFVQRRRARTDRRTVVVSLSAKGRHAVDEATAVRRAAIRGALSVLSVEEQRAAALALRALSRCAGEVPDDQWPAPGT